MVLFMFVVFLLFVVWFEFMPALRAAGLPGGSLDDFKNDCCTFIPQLAIPNGFAVNECVTSDFGKPALNDVSHIVHQERAVASNDEVQLALCLYYLTDCFRTLGNFFLPLKKQAVGENGNLVSGNVARENVAVGLSKEMSDVIRDVHIVCFWLVDVRIIMPIT